MGDRFYLSLDCAYCGAVNSDVYYAPTCEVFDFTCSKCNKVNFITAGLSSKKVEDTTEDDVAQAIEMATSVVRTAAEIKRYAKMSHKSFLKWAGLKNG